MDLQIICKELGHFYNKQVLFINFNNSFKMGEKYVFVGHNGSGKSTMLNLLMGDIRPRKGKIDFLLDGNKILRNQLHQYISACTPAQHMFDQWTGKEAFDFNFKLKKMSNPSLSASEITTLSTNDLKKNIKNYSSGMMQRLKLGIALHSQAQIYYLDEPTMNLDKAGFDWFVGMLKNLPKQSIVLMASNLKNEIDLINQKNIISIENYKP